MSTYAKVACPECGGSGCYQCVGRPEQEFLRELTERRVTVTFQGDIPNITLSPGWRMGNLGIRGKVERLVGSGKAVHCHNVFIRWASILFLKDGSGLPYQEDLEAITSPGNDPCAKGHTKCYGDCNRCLVCEGCKCRSGAL